MNKIICVLILMVSVNFGLETTESNGSLEKGDQRRICPHIEDIMNYAKVRAMFKYQEGTLEYKKYVNELYTTGIIDSKEMLKIGRMPIIEICRGLEHYSTVNHPQNFEQEKHDPYAANIMRYAKAHGFWYLKEGPNPAPGYISIFLERGAQKNDLYVNLLYTTGIIDSKEMLDICRQIIDCEKDFEKRVKSNEE